MRKDLLEMNTIDAKNNDKVIMLDRQIRFMLFSLIFTREEVDDRFTFLKSHMNKQES